MALAAIALLIISMLSGCGCSKESKIIGTWEEKFDVEEEYGTPENEIDKKLIGKWINDVGKGSIKIYADHRDWTTNKDNGEITVVKTVEKDYDNPDDRSNIEKYDAYFSYDQGKNTLTCEKLVSKSTGQEAVEYYEKGKEKNWDDLSYLKGRVYERVSAETYTKATYVFNKDNTGTYTESRRDSIPINWSLTEDSNIIINTVNEKRNREMHLTYDPDKDTIKNESNKKDILFRAKNSK